MNWANARTLYRRGRWVVLVVLSAILVVVVYLRVPARLSLGTLDLPTGFAIAVFADSLPGVRSLALGDRGTVFAGTRSEGFVYAVRDTDGDGRTDQRFTIDEDLYMPNGVAFRDGALYVADVTQIFRYDSIEATLSAPPEPVVVRSGFPDNGWHGWRYIAFGPDDMLYMTIGVPCNSCLQEDDRFGTIVRMHADGSDLEIVARGVRNSLGLTWHPVTGDLWFTDNGRDLMGNNEPPDELNRLPSVGAHFGFPYCHGGTIQDGEFSDRPCDEFVPPVQPLGPHVASLGLAFYTGKMFPEEYRGQLFIAEHGSWNRFPPSGYRVSVVRLDEKAGLAYEPFVDGWLRAGRASGTPVDLLLMPDGSLLVSDDRAGKIYRITYAE